MTIEWLDCCCCGMATKGRQWYNRDDGYGLCDCCIEYCNADIAVGETHDDYGRRGYHYDLPAEDLTKSKVK